MFTNIKIRETQKTRWSGLSKVWKNKQNVIQNLWTLLNPY